MTTSPTDYLRRIWYDCITYDLGVHRQRPHQQPLHPGPVRRRRLPAASISARPGDHPAARQALEGPVYFRSNGGERNLPDLVADLHGQVHIDPRRPHRLGSQGRRIRTSFEPVPDAPVSKFILEMEGGKKGLLVNSSNLCKHNAQGQVDSPAKNGRS